MSKRLLILGDSIARGYNDEEELGWGNRLRKYTQKKSKELIVYNRSISGDNSETLLKRLQFELDIVKPEYVIIAIGINDSQYIDSADHSEVDLDNFSNNISKIYNTCIESGVGGGVFFVSISNVDESKTMPIPWDDKIYYSNEMISKYDQVIAEICEKNNCVKIKIDSLQIVEDLFDGLHPNAKGHEKMFNNIKESLIKNKIIV